MKIQYRVLLLVAFVTIVPTAVFSSIFFYVGRHEMSLFIYDRVQGMNEVKKEQVLHFYQDNVEHVAEMAAMAEVQTSMSVLNVAIKNTQTAEYRTQEQKIKSLIAEKSAEYVHDDIKLLNNEQRVIYVTNPHYSADVGKVVDGELLGIARAGGSGVQASRPFINASNDNEYEMYFSAPVKDTNGLSLGTVVLEVEVTELFGQINDAQGLSITGETVLAVNDGYSALMLTALKYDPLAALTKRITFGDNRGTGIQNSVRGMNGRGEIKDYRGVTVLAAWSAIPELNWGIVTKIDKSEAFSAMNIIARYVMVLIPAIVVIMLLFFFFSIRGLLFGPLKHLTEVALKLAYGDTYSDINPKLMTPRDNMGQLAIALHNLRRTLRHGPPATTSLPSEAPDNYHHDEKPKDLHQG